MTRSISIVSDAAARRGENKLTGFGGRDELKTLAPRSQALGHFCPCPTCGKPTLVWRVTASNKSSVGCWTCGADIMGAA